MRGLWYLNKYSLCHKERAGFIYGDDQRNAHWEFRDDFAHEKKILIKSKLLYANSYLNVQTANQNKIYVF